MSEIKVGDRVTVIGVTPNESFEGCKGTIVRAGVFHEWIVDVTFPDGNHDELGYDEFELTATAQPAPAHAAGDYVHEYLDMMGAIPHPDARTRIGELLQRVGRAHSDALADKEWQVSKARELEAQLAATEARLQAAVAFYALMVNIDVLGDIADSLANEETWEVWGELAHLTEVLRGEWNPLPASEKGE